MNKVAEIQFEKVEKCRQKHGLGVGCNVDMYTIELKICGPEDAKKGSDFDRRRKCY